MYRFLSLFAKIRICIFTHNIHVYIYIHTCVYLCMYIYTDMLTHMHMPLPHMHTPAQTNVNPYENLHTKVTQTHQTHRTIKQTKKQPNRQTSKGPLHPPNPPPHATLAPPPKTGEKRTDKHAHMCTCMGKQKETQPTTDRQTCQDKDTHTRKQTDI